MSRERTTWNRAEIARTAAMPKQADPYLMNQDHVSKNPPADKYMNGTPSSWAEDVHSPNEWEKEYSGGATKRDEIGLPDFRPETFTHSEKSASDKAILVKKADLAVRVARLLLKKASDEVIEDQAVSLMALPDSDLIDTFQRLAQDEQGQEAPKDQGQQQAAQQGEQQGQEAPKDQQQQAAQQDQGEQAPADQGQQQAGMQQQSAAYQAAMQQCMEAMQMGDQQKAQAAVQQMVQEAMTQQQAGQAEFPGGQWGKNNPVASKKKADRGQGQGQGQGQQQKQQAGMDQQAMQQQIQAMVDQAVQSMQQQGQPQQQEQVVQDQGQQFQASDDQLLDDMLAPATAGAVDMSGLGDIQLETSPMDVGEVQMTAEDDVLKTLFANQETEDAQKAQDHEQGQQHQASVVRTASTRTVGTRPTAGVGRIGGVTAPATKTASNDVDKLQSLWSSAPDVREHFGIR